MSIESIWQSIFNTLVYNKIVLNKNEKKEEKNERRKKLKKNKITEKNLKTVSYNRRITS